MPFKLSTDAQLILSPWCLTAALLFSHVYLYTFNVSSALEPDWGPLFSSLSV